jgi:hypothetical protein
LQQQQLKWEPLVIVDFARLARIDRNANPARRIIQNQQLESVSEFPKLSLSLSWCADAASRVSQLNLFPNMQPVRAQRERLKSAGIALGKSF